MKYIMDENLLEQYENENGCNYSELKTTIIKNVKNLFFEWYNDCIDFENSFNDFLHCNTINNLYNYIPTKYDGYVFNKCIILNEHPLFKNNLGDIICLFFVDYFQPSYNHKYVLYYMDCDYEINEMDVETLFRFIYFYFDDDKNPLLEL